MRKLLPEEKKIRLATYVPEEVYQAIEQERAARPWKPTMSNMLCEFIIEWFASNQPNRKWGDMYPRQQITKGAGGVFEMDVDDRKNYHPPSFSKSERSSRLQPKHPKETP